MLQEIFSLIDVALEQKMRTQCKADHIDLDQYYTHYCEGRLTLPKLAPYRRNLPERLVTFTEARALYNKGEKPDGCIYHYIDDKRFQCVYRNPAEYLPMYKACGKTIGPDFSLYITSPESEKRLNVFRNHLLSLIWQHYGIEGIPNVSWAEPFSFEYCFNPYPSQSVVAINSMGCRAVPVSGYFWEKGFLKALERLEPTAIIRYGPRMVMEEEGISRFYQNPHLTRMRTHKSCEGD